MDDDRAYAAFSEAVRILAVGPQRIQERLLQAWLVIVHIPAAAMTPDDRREWEDRKAFVTSAGHSGGDVAWLKDTMHLLTDEEASREAEWILSKAIAIAARAAT